MVALSQMAFIIICLQGKKDFYIKIRIRAGSVGKRWLLATEWG
jgi:hypothetical protein